MAVYKPKPKKKMPITVKTWLYRCLFLIGGIILIFPIYRYIKAQLAKGNEQDVELEKNKSWLANLNPQTQLQRANKITKNTELHAVAKQLSHDLGTKYSDKNSWFSWMNPKGWTENDEKVMLALIKYRLYYPTLCKLYYSCYSNSRSLEADLLELLDEKELKRLRGSIKI